MYVREVYVLEVHVVRWVATSRKGGEEREGALGLGKGRERGRQQFHQLMLLHLVWYCWALQNLAQPWQVSTQLAGISLVVSAGSNWQQQPQLSFRIVARHHQLT